MTVTLKDVAEYLNISPSTVSRVINRSGYVSEKKRRLVQEAIVELGYHPDLRARALRGKPSKMVGLIIPDILNTFYASVSKAVEETLAEQDYNMILCVSGDDSTRDLTYLQLLWRKRVDGIIYVPPASGENSAYVRHLVAEGMPMIELNRQREQDLLDAVLADNFKGAYQATEYLLNLGHERIGFICGSVEITTGKNRLAAYRRAMEDAGVPIEPVLVKIGRFNKEHGMAATEELLQLSPRPTAIFATSNRILLGTLAILIKYKVRIPEEISVIVFDDAEWLSIWHPPITAVDIAIEEMATLAVQLLLRRINKGGEKERQEKPVTYSLSTALLERASCKRVGPPHKCRKISAEP